ncbi:hypothetical protein HY086_05100 [Candidatus Gottesmanbacteria bacterium]|nr:hypothetical protein [Candidatus Gottesmanbacteria bacterium]
MVFFLVFFLELAILFAFSQVLPRRIHAITYQITKSQSVATSFVSILLFPGTIVHELSHLIVAEVLGVRTGTLSLVPEAIEDQEGQLRTGSVTIAHTDPIRRALIGIAPLGLGLLILTSLSYLTTIWFPQGWKNLVPPEGEWLQVFQLALMSYLFFAISNTMFSSPEDLKGFVPLVITLFFFAGAGYVAGVRISITGQAQTIITTMASTLVKSLGGVLAVNGVLLLVLKILLGVMGKFRNFAGR